jgi:hypothetical protein
LTPEQFTPQTLRETPATAKEWQRWRWFCLEVVTALRQDDSNHHDEITSSGTVIIVVGSR